MGRVRKVNGNRVQQIDWDALIDEYVSLSGTNSGSIRIDKGLYRTVSGGTTADPYSGFLTSALSNVWFFRSGYGSGYDDIVVRRIGTIALDIFNITDSRSILKITDDGDLIVRGKLTGIFSVIPFYSSTTPLSTIPGTVYVHVFADLDNYIPLTALSEIPSRLNLTVKGSGSGTKSIRIIDSSSSISFGSFTWEDSNKYSTFSTWTTLSLSGATTTEIDLNIEMKSTDASETIDIYRLDVFLQEVK